MADTEAKRSLAMCDPELVKRAVRSATSRTERRPVWACVADTFCVGRGVAAELCRRFDRDPDEMVGPESLVAHNGSGDGAEMTTETDEEAAIRIACEVHGWDPEHNSAMNDWVGYWPDEKEAALRGIAHGRTQVTKSQRR